MLVKGATERPRNDLVIRVSTPAFCSAAAPCFCGTQAAELDPNHRRYYYFTASLLLWNQSLGMHFPQVKFWWRIEPDVAFSGAWSALLQRIDDASAGSHEADVLLPRVIPYRVDPGFPHYAKNLDVLQGLPKSSWCRSLVSIGRYSQRFMAHMAEVWHKGMIGFEEVFLPTQCVLLREKCRLRSLHNVTAKAALRIFSSADARHPPVNALHFRYQPEVAGVPAHTEPESTCTMLNGLTLAFSPARQVTCEDFVRAVALDTQELWHPLKRRQCWLDQLERRLKPPSD